MQNKKTTFTIFTPTFNRAYIIPQLYNSLINQTIKDFTWLIIDDGSTDNTEELINSYINEDKINIEFYKQKNQGKHIAINNSYNYINSEYYLIVDSDDYLLNNAIEICLKISNEIKQNNMNAKGFSFINSTENNNSKNLTLIKTYDYKSLNFNINGEKLFVFKSDIIKNNKFPIFKNEKFCQEALILIPIINKYNILYTNYILARAQYLEDGLTNNLYNNLLNSPNYTLKTLIVKYTSNIYSQSEKNNLVMSYWDIALKSKSVSKIKALLEFPLIGTLYYIKKRFF